MSPRSISDLLGPQDPPPFTLVNETGKARCLILADHAGRAVPEKLNRLGIAEKQFDRHYAYDIGVRYLAQKLAYALDAPAILGNYSRLVVDCNRQLDHPTAFLTRGEDLEVPANLTLNGEEKKARVEAIYEPYHNVIRQKLAGFKKDGVVPAVISLHSFTPMLFGQERLWEMAVLWTRDNRMVDPVLRHFRAQGLNVGDNEPYDARLLRGSTMNIHADAAGLPNILIEMRQDLIDTDEKGDGWVKNLSDCFSHILANDSLYKVYEGPPPEYDPEEEIREFEDLLKKAKKGEL